MSVCASGQDQAPRENRKIEGNRYETPSQDQWGRARQDLRIETFHLDKEHESSVLTPIADATIYVKVCVRV